MELKKRRILIFLFVVISLLSSVHAAPGPSDVLQTFFDVMSNQNMVDFLTILFMFTLILGIVYAAAKYAKLFEGNNKARKGFGVAFSGIATLGLFFGAGVTTRTMVERILGAFFPAGIFFIAAILGILTYNLFDRSTWCIQVGAGLISFGMAFLVYGSILNVRWTKSIGTVAMVFGGIMLLVCAFRNREPDVPAPPPPPVPPIPPNPPGPGPGPGPTPPTPLDISTQLTNLNNALTNYRTQFAQFQMYANDILQTHHDHINSLGGYGPPLPPVSPDQLNRMYNSAQQLANTANTLDSIVYHVQNHPEYANIIPAQLATFATYVTDIATEYANFSAFDADFWTRYHNGDPPA
ncbi:hypothetical protein K9M79_01175 [Candidatus Woesearchaeota archaeon]|nr:hypothetical protein [Candidatus Woesearchaeota archaeon]